MGRRRRPGLERVGFLDVSFALYLIGIGVALCVLLGVLQIAILVAWTRILITR